MTANASLPRRRFLGRVLAGLTAGARLGRARPAQADAQGYEPYIAEIKMFAGNFAPTGWAFCQGQLLPINEYDALFSLIGTSYGGDGQVTFALPDLRGRGPVHMGTGPGGITWQLGQTGGSEAVTLSVSQLPAHTHTAGASSGNGSSDSPAGAVPARNAAGVPQYAATANASLAAGTVLSTGGTQPHDNMQPYLGINFIISLFGVYPSPS